MRLLSTLILFVLAAPAVMAGETAEPVTAFFPKRAKIALRLPSLDRLDAIALQVHPFVQMVDRDAAASMRRLPLSATVIHGLGLDAEDPFDRTRPMFVTFDFLTEENMLFLPIEPGSRWVPRELKDEKTGEVRGDYLCIAKEALLALETRGRATPFLGGDVGIKVYIAELADENRTLIEVGLAKLLEELAGAPLGAIDARKLSAAVGSLARDSMYGVESLDYTFTWKQGQLHSQGILRVRDGAPLRGFIGRAGTPGENPLIGYLPKSSFLVMDAVSNPDWPGKEISQFAAAALGDEVGAPVSRAILSNSHIWDKLTGRMAVSVDLGAVLGMPTSISIVEGKPDADLDAAFAKLDTAGITAAVRKLGLDFDLQLERAVETYNTVAIHKMTTKIAIPMPGMPAGGAQTQTSCVAVVNNLMLTASGLDPMGSIKRLIDRVQKGETVEHPHAKAIQDLGERRHNLAFSINIGGFKPFAMIFMLAGVPDVAQAIASLPDEVYITTVVSVWEGHLHWRGSWPVKEAVKIADRVIKAQEARELAAQAAMEEDFE
ncbi:MAG: hypothetical protein V3T86_13095 [Planctomycetota bacterium]